MLNQNGERLMPYKQRNGFGRYWTAQTFGIQNMSRRIRHAICKNSMVDIDMKNAHPTLLSWYCHKHRIKCEAHDKYIKSREPMLQDLVNCRHITRDEANKFLLAIMNGKQINLQPGDPPWLISYYAGMRNIIRAVVQLNPELYELAKQSKYNHYNLERSTINHLLCGLENKALMVAFDYLNGKGIEVAVLVFDGLMIYKNDVTDIAGILQGCSPSVYQVLKGCDIEFTVKEMDEGYDIPSTTNQPTSRWISIFYYKREFIHTSIWIPLIASKKLSPHRSGNFTAACQMKVYPRKITSIPRKFGKLSTVKTLGITIISI